MADIPPPSWAKPGPQPSSMLMRGRVVTVNRSTVSQDLTMTFDVALDTGGVHSVGPAGVIKDVLMLQAGVGNLQNPVNSPTGIIYIPEEGSRVLVAYDGAGYVIIGCYTGPVIAPAAAAMEGKPLENTRMVTADPGIEKTASKVGNMFLGGESNWLLGANPGDAIMGKGLARVKVTSDAVVLGTTPSCLIMLKANDERLERCKELDVRMIGYQKSHRAFMGESTLANLHMERPEANPAPAAGVITTEVFEATPYAMARKAFMLSQRGHVTNGIKDDARQALLGQIGILDILTEESVQTFTLARDAVIQPLPTAIIGRVPAAELMVDHYTTYDRQIRSDGAWFIRGGNATRLPTTGERFSGCNLDMHMGYLPLTNQFKVGVGQKGVWLASITLDGITGDVKVQAGSTEVTLGTTGVSVTTLGDVTVNAGKSASITSAGSLDIKAASVGITASTISLGGTVSVGGKPFLAHTHPYVNVAAPAATGPVTP